jgi:CMP-N-acetylneuraminic acid synthetase
MKLVAMIPARLGSKRIPKKNLRYLQSKPLLQYAIDIAKSSECFDEIWVNSESELLGDLAKQCEASFHQRPEELSTDQATNQQFTAEFLEHHLCDYVIMVNSTSPLLSIETIRDFCSFVRSNNYDSIFSVIDEQAECFYDGSPLNFTTSVKVNSQDLTPIRKIVWALTAWKRETFLSTVLSGGCGTYAGNIGLFSIPKDESCDLDTPADWAIAEGMLQARSMNTAEAVYWDQTTKKVR